MFEIDLNSDLGESLGAWSMGDDAAMLDIVTTDEGMKDIGYIGNMALPKWDPPPPAVLKHLGLA